MSDLIDRQKAIDALRYAQHRFTVADEAGGFGTVKWSEDVIYFAAAERVLSELPSAQPKKACVAEIKVDIDDLKDYIDKTIDAERWIPCSERLPDMHDEVLVTARGEVSIAWLYVDGKWRSNDMPQPMFRDIIAWMPLPEPYREEGEE